jgi:hypothetical protein
MYDFVYLSVRRSVRDSHWFRDYREGTGIRVFYENPGFYIISQGGLKVSIPVYLGRPYFLREGWERKVDYTSHTVTNPIWLSIFFPYMAFTV